MATRTDLKISARMLHAFVDGWLDPIDHAVMADRVKANPALSRRVDSYRKQNQELQLLYAANPNEAIPERFKELINAMASLPAIRRAG